MKGSAATDKKGSEKSEKRKKTEQETEGENMAVQKMTAQDIIRRLDMVPLGAEGGMVKETWRARKRIMGFQTEVPFTICLQRILFLIYIA